MQWPDRDHSSLDREVEGKLKECPQQPRNESYLRKRSWSIDTNWTEDGRLKATGFCNIGYITLVKALSFSDVMETKSQFVWDLEDQGKRDHIIFKKFGCDGEKRTANPFKIFLYQFLYLWGMSLA